MHESAERGKPKGGGVGVGGEACSLVLVNLRLVINILKEANPKSKRKSRQGEKTGCCGSFEDWKRSENPP